MIETMNLSMSLQLLYLSSDTFSLRQCEFTCIKLETISQNWNRSKLDITLRSCFISTITTDIWAMSAWTTSSWSSCQIDVKFIRCGNLQYSQTHPMKLQLSTKFHPSDFGFTSVWDTTGVPNSHKCQKPGFTLSPHVWNWAQFYHKNAFFNSFDLLKLALHNILSSLSYVRWPDSVCFNECATSRKTWSTELHWLTDWLQSFHRNRTYCAIK